MSEYDELMQQKAVALKYNPEKNGAPVIVASGMGYMAERITETALEAGVPVYEDDSLATLLTQLFPGLYSCRKRAERAGSRTGGCSGRRRGQCTGNLSGDGTGSPKSSGRRRSGQPQTDAVTGFWTLTANR